MTDTPPTPEPLPEESPPEPTPEVLAFTQVCELLGFDPTTTTSLVITPTGPIAISTDLIEPPTEGLP